jgi:hypothetical protein
MTGVSAEKLEAALKLLARPSGQTEEEYQGNVETIRQLWCRANDVPYKGNSYNLINFDRAPFPEHEKNFKTFEGWFNYFYTDCKADKRIEFYKECLNPDGSFKGDFASNDSVARDGVRKHILERMLQHGFVAYKEDEFYGAGDDLLPPLMKEMTPLRVGFRGELRSPDLVKLHDGCRAKAAVDSLRSRLGMNERWHPFSDPAVRSKAYFRAVDNMDNCLFTVVSLALDFERASKFPLMQDLNREEPDAIGSATVLAKGIGSRVKEMAAALQDQISAQRGITPINQYPDPKPSGGTERRLLRCVRMSVYIFTLPNGWNTAKMQAKYGAEMFPERATLSIPWGNFLARVRCDRIQYDDNDSNKGHLLIVSGYDWLQDHDKLIAAAGGNRTAVWQLRRFLNDLCERGSLRMSGKGGIHVNPGTGYNICPIDSVERLDPRRGWL